MKQLPIHKTGFIWHEIYMWHDTGGFCGSHRSTSTLQPADHYESPEPKRRIRNLLEVSGMLEHLTTISAVSIKQEDLLRVHSEAYVDFIQSQRNTIGAVDAETPLALASVAIAGQSVGGAIAATKAVMQGEVDNAYALLRPPGHHAEPAR